MISFGLKPPIRLVCHSGNCGAGLGLGARLILTSVLPDGTCVAVHTSTGAITSPACVRSLPFGRNPTGTSAALLPKLVSWIDPGGFLPVLQELFFMLRAVSGALTCLLDELLRRMLLGWFCRVCPAGRTAPPVLFFSSVKEGRHACSVA